MYNRDNVIEIKDHCSKILGHLIIIFILGMKSLFKIFFKSKLINLIQI